MKKLKKTILILSLILLFGTMPRILWAEGESLNNESWQSLKPGTYNNESWQSLKPGTYNNESWQSKKPGTYTNKSWQSKKPGTYINESWQSKKPGTYIDKSWQPKKSPCSQHYIKLVKPIVTFVGDKIAIRGRRFGKDIGKVVFDQDIPGEIISWRNQRIEVLVPEGALTGMVKVIKPCSSGSKEEYHYIEIKNSESE